MADARRPRLRAHVIAPVPAVLGAGLMASSAAMGQPNAVDDEFDAYILAIPQDIGNVLDNDQGDGLNVVSFTAATFGQANVTSFGAVTYAGSEAGICEAQSDSFSYTVFDGQDTDNALVTINLLPPVEEDSYTIPMDGVLEANVRDNDPFSAETTNTLTVTSFTAPANGTLSDTDPSGQFRYEPDPGFSGIDGFQYTVNDSELGCNWNVAVQVTVTELSEPTPIPALGTGMLGLLTALLGWFSWLGLRRRGN